MKRSSITQTNIITGRIAQFAVAALLCTALGARADQVKSASVVPLDNTQSWVGGAVPGPTELAIFDSTFGTAPMTCGISGYVDILGITCSNNMGTNFLIVASGKMTNGASGIDRSAANKDFTIQTQPMALSASQTWDVNAGRTLRLQNCSLNFGANSLNLNSTAGGGTIIMPNSLVGTGPWTIGPGAMVKLTTGGAPYPTNTTTISAGGVLDLNGVNGQAAGTTLNLNGTGLGAGGALISSAASFLNAPTVNLQNPTSIGGAASLTINAGSPITGSGSLAKVGAGTLTINSACSFSGGVNLDAGTIKLGSATALGAPAGTLTIAGGTTLDATAALTLPNNNPVVVNGDFTWTGTQALNVGTNSVTLGAAAGTTRAITANGQALRLGSLVDGATATNLVKLGGGSLYFNSTNSTFLSGALTCSNGTLLVANLNSSAPLMVPGTITVWGASSRFQPNDNPGCTTVYNGPVIGNGLFYVFSQGQCVLGGDNSVFTGKLSIYRFVRLTNAKGLGGASTTLNLDRQWDNAYVDLNGLSVSGVTANFISSGNNGGTNQFARLRNASSNAASFAGNIITAGTTNTVGVDGSGDMLLSGSISGDSGLLKLGTGTLTLTGSNTYSGTTTVSNGTLLVNGVIVGNGVAVSTNASLGGSGTIGGNVTLSSGALALFTNGSTLTIFGSLTANANVVQLHLPANVPTNTYLLATYNPTGSSGSLASTPAVLSGSFAAGTTHYITTAGGQVNLVVETLVTTPAVTNITYSVSGGQLVLDWPDGQGWQLQAQTNSLNTGVTPHWFSVPGATPPYTNAIDPANPAVFYRLTYP